MVQGGSGFPYAGLASLFLLSFLSLSFLPLFVVHVRGCLRAEGGTV